jgi:hypothetical protein
MERQTKTTLSELNELAPFSSANRMVAQICVSLARNIDAGNVKGRAIANEAAQLVAMLQTVQGLDNAEVAALPPELLELMQAFTSQPQVTEPAP